MKAKLLVVGGTTSMTEVNLRLPAIIGRSRSAQVTIPHSLVSRQHCEISASDGQLVVEDLNSLNGTYVGDERITKANLPPGELLTVGTVTFRAVYQIGGEEPCADSADDTCLDTDTVDADQINVADLDTVPVESTSFRESKKSSSVTPELGSELSDEPSLESASQNSE